MCWNIQIQITFVVSSDNHFCHYNFLPAAWKKPIGLEKLGGKSKILDSQLVSSSSMDKTHIATKARLYGANSWCGKCKGQSHLQIDLGDARQLTGIAIQGDEKAANWVTYFDLGYGYLSNELVYIKVRS